MDITAFANQWLMNVSTDLSRYVVFAVAVWLTLWVILARPLVGRKIRPDTPKPQQLLLEFGASIRSIAIFSTIGLVAFTLERFGLLPGPALAAQWGPGWAWTTLALIIMAHDAYFYWTHRLIHDPRLFRALHRRHHKSHNPSPFTAYSFDIGEAAIQALFVPLWMILVPTQWWVVGVFMIHQIARNTLGHSGYELFPARRDGRPLFDFLTTTTHHDLHHAQAGYNFGLYFTWWDRLMGTEHPEYHARFAAATRRQIKPVKAPAAVTIILVAMLLAASPQPARAQSTSIYDDWATPGLGGVVRLSPCASDRSLLCGRLTWAWDPRELHDNALGSMIVRDFVWRGSEWRDGRVLNPEDGRTYAGSIHLDGDVLRLRGCAGPFCQTQIWRRLSTIPRP